MTVQKGIARTQLTSNPQQSSPLLPTPVMFSRIWATDANADGTGREGLAQDGPYQTNSNLTNNYSSGSWQAPGADLGIDIITWSNGVNGQMQGISNADQTGKNGLRGPRMGNITIFIFKGFPKPTAGAPVNSDLIYFFGLSKNVAASGVFPGICSLTANAALVVPTWMANIAVAGFYYRPKISPNWLLLTSNGAGGSTQVDSGVTASNTLSQECIFTFDGTNMVFYINGAKVGTIVNNLPSASFGMCLNMIFGNVGSVATGLAESFGFLYEAVGFR